jgi:RNA polymerase sigma-70 factor (ECF subfamily)
MMVDEEQVLLGFINGDIDHFYAGMYSKLLAYAVRCLGSNYSFLAEDCVQDAIVSSYEKRSTFELAWQLKGYVYTCVHNNCIELLRKTMREDKFASQQKTDIDEEVSAGMIEQETYDLLHRAIDELPDQYRQIFELNYEQGLKMKEVADALDITFEALKKRKIKMFNLLRERFKDNPAMQSLLFILSIC